MRKKLRLDLDNVRVESFPTGGADAGPRGTVRAAQLEGCTRFDSCDCPTAYYRCVEHPFTFYSCDYLTVQGYTNCW
ncbi:MAG TPA: hypothetical protein VFQ45_14845 [Longimicrobium sp.]|nr:hypothetical protein [Longimicrobium sp.]